MDLLFPEEYCLVPKWKVMQAIGGNGALNSSKQNTSFRLLLNSDQSRQYYTNYFLREMAYTIPKLVGITTGFYMSSKFLSL